MKLMTQRNVLGLSLASLLMTGCGGGGSGTANQTPTTPQLSVGVALEALADHSIVPAFRDVAQTAQNLQQKSSDFCQQTNETNLTDLQNEWKTFAKQWNRVMVYNFGPMNSSDNDTSNDFFQQMLYIESKFLKGNDYTSEVRTEIAQSIAGTQSLDKAYFDALAVTKVGILALESLLFESHLSPYSQIKTDIISDYQQHARKCQVLTGMATQATKHTTQFADKWQNSYRTIFVSGTLDDGNSSIAELLTKAQGHLDYIKSRKLQGTLDAQLADHAKENIKANIAEIRRLVFGTQSSDHSLAKQMLLNGNANASAVNSVEANLTQVENSLNAITGSLKTADLTALSSAIGLLDGNFKREIPDALGVTLGINFNDGD